MKALEWKQDENDEFWVVEDDGMLRTGPFATKEAARFFFLNELNVEISIEGDSDERENEEASEVESEITTEDTEYLGGRGPTETFISHCPGCAKGT